MQEPRRAALVTIGADWRGCGSALGRVSRRDYRKCAPASRRFGRAHVGNLTGARPPTKVIACRASSRPNSAGRHVRGELRAAPQAGIAQAEDEHAASRPRRPTRQKTPPPRAQPSDARTGRLGWKWSHPRRVDAYAPKRAATRTRRVGSISAAVSRRRLATARARGPSPWRESTAVSTSRQGHHGRDRARATFAASASSSRRSARRSLSAASPARRCAASARSRAACARAVKSRASFSRESMVASSLSESAPGTRERVACSPPGSVAPSDYETGSEWTLCPCSRGRNPTRAPARTPRRQVESFPSIQRAMSRRGGEAFSARRWVTLRAPSTTWSPERTRRARRMCSRASASSRRARSLSRAAWMAIRK